MYEDLSVISFCAHRGGTGRSATCVMTAEAMTIYGENVAIVDFDFEAPGLLAMSTIKRPNPLFQPDNLYNIEGDGKSLLDQVRSNVQEIKIDGFAETSLVFMDTEGNVKPGVGIDHRVFPSFLAAKKEFYDKLPIYEVRPAVVHPLEGRMFVVPLGGKFKQIIQEESDKETLQIRTEWAYRPSDVKQDERSQRVFQRIIQSGQIGRVIREFDRCGHNFFRELAEAIKRRVDGKQTAKRTDAPKLNYVLFDQRPGFSGRSIQGASSSDGVVLVGLPSRSGMISVRAQLDEFVSSEAQMREYVKKLQEPDGAFRESQVLGVVINALTASAGEAKTREPAIDAIATNFKESELLTRLAQETDVSNDSSVFCTLPTKRDFQYYRQNFSLLGDRYRGDARSFKEDVSARGDDDDKEIFAAAKLWNRLGFKASGEGDEKADMIAAFACVLPTGFDENMRLFDITVDFRHPTENNTTERGIADTIIVLAGHILETLPRNGNLEADTRNRLYNLRAKPIESVEGQDIGITKARSLSWRGYLSYILANSRREKEAEKLCDWADELDLVESKQAAAVDAIIGGDVRGWKKDWRVSALRGDLLKAAEKWDKAAVAYKDAVDIAGSWAKFMAEKDDDAERNPANELSPASMIEGNQLELVLMDMNAARAECLAKSKKMSNAYGAYKDAFGTVTESTRGTLIDKTRAFFWEWAKQEGNKRDVLEATEDVIATQIIKYTESPKLGLQYKKRHAEFADIAFWLYDQSGRETLDKKNQLGTIFKAAQVWLDAVSGNKITPSDFEVSQINAIYGKAAFHLAFIDEDANKLDYIRKAQEAFEKAANLDETNIQHHFDLALAQEHSICLNWAVKSADTNQGDTYQIGNFKREQKIKARSAFYSFEQVFGLFVKPKDQDFFFEPEDAQILSENLLEALSAVVEITSDNDKTLKYNKRLFEAQERLHYTTTSVAAIRVKRNFSGVNLSLNRAMISDFKKKFQAIYEEQCRE